MSETCPTVRIKSASADQGFVIINQADFIDGTDELFDPVNSDGDKVLSLAQIRDALTARGVEFDPRARKADLAALLAG